MKTYLQLYFTFLRLGAFTFGGGLAMLPLMQHEIVAQRGWMTEEELIDIYATAQCAPGIIAINTSVYVGSHVAGIWGSIAAVLGEITSPMCLIACIALLFRHLTDEPLFKHALAGIRAMICALLCHTVWVMGKKSLVDRLTAALCVLSFVLSWFAGVPLIVLTIGAGLAGVMLGRGKT